MLRRVRANSSLRATLFVALFLVAGVECQSQPDTLPNPYRAPIEHWGQLPEGRTWGAVTGQSFDSKGHLWVLERCEVNSCLNSNLAPILEMDPQSGRVLKSFGSGMMVLPHALLVDTRDHDNIWVVDEGKAEGKGEQVRKFSPDGKVLMTLGKAGMTGNGPDTFNDPTGVAIGRHGDIFVTDGHVGSPVGRIVKFSKEGRFLQTWGKKGSEPGDLNDPHSITIDSRGRLFVADRGNGRIQIFDQDGKLLGEWKQFGIPSGVFIDKHDVLYVTENVRRGDWQRGIRIGSAKDGTVAAFIPDPDQDPKDAGIGPETVLADAKGNLFIGEVDRRMMKRFIKQ